MVVPRPALAATVSDPDGFLATKMRDLVPALRGRFDHVSVVCTRDTDATVVAALRAVERLEFVTREIECAGLHRRRSVELSLALGAEAVLYADFDHILRWLERAPDELDVLLTRPLEADLVVIGRSPAGLEASPERLRRTESIVNDLLALVTGCEWDLLMAARLMSRRAAAAVVRHAKEPGLASDVEWPLLLRRLGHSARYEAAEGLRYETNAQWGAGEADTGDRDLDAWLFRVELAGQYLRVLREHAANASEPAR